MDYQDRSNADKLYPILYRLSLDVQMSNDGQMNAQYDNVWCKIGDYRLRISQTRSFLPTAHYDDSKVRYLIQGLTKRDYFLFDLDFMANGLLSFVPGMSPSFNWSE